MLFLLFFKLLQHLDKISLTCLHSQNNLLLPFCYNVYVVEASKPSMPNAMSFSTLEIQIPQQCTLICKTLLLEPTLSIMDFFTCLIFKLDGTT